MAFDLSAGADIGSSGEGGTFSSDFLGSIFGGNSSSNAAPAASSVSASSGMNGNSLFAALANDATKVFGAYEVASTAKYTVKKNPNASTYLIIAVGGIAALVLVMLLVRK